METTPQGVILTYEYIWMLMRYKNNKRFIHTQRVIE